MNRQRQQVIKIIEKNMPPAASWMHLETWLRMRFGCRDLSIAAAFAWVQEHAPYITGIGSCRLSKQVPTVAVTTSHY